MITLSSISTISTFTIPVAISGDEIASIADMHVAAAAFIRDFADEFPQDDWGMEQCMDSIRLMESTPTVDELRIF